MFKRIILAAGHGGGDSGATGQGTTEAAECIQIVNRLADKLRADGQLEVVVVPHELNLVPEIDWVNARYGSADDGICLEVHKNSTMNAHGIEVWYYSGDQGSANYAQTVLNGIMSVPGMPVSRGIKGDATNRWGSLGWIRETNPVALLAEMGFISDGGDGVDDGSDNIYAEGLKVGILAAFGLTPKPAVVAAPVVIPPTATAIAFRVYDHDGKQLGAYNTKAGAWNKYLTGGTKIVDTATGKDVTGDFVNKYRPTSPVTPAEPHPIYDPAKDVQQDSRLSAIESFVVLVKAFLARVGIKL